MTTDSRKNRRPWIPLQFLSRSDAAPNESRNGQQQDVMALPPSLPTNKQPSQERFSRFWLRKGGGNIENTEGDGGIRRSNRIKTAKRVVKIGGIEYF